jgi:hypothetical protein
MHGSSDPGRNCQLELEGGGDVHLETKRVQAAIVMALLPSSTHCLGAGNLDLDFNACLCLNARIYRCPFHY